MIFNPLHFDISFFIFDYGIALISVISNAFLTYLILTQTKLEIGTYKYLMIGFAVYDIVYSTIFGQFKVVSFDSFSLSL